MQQPMETLALDVALLLNELATLEVRVISLTDQLPKLDARIQQVTKRLTEFRLLVNKNREAVREAVDGSVRRHEQPDADQR